MKKFEHHVLNGGSDPSDVQDLGFGTKQEILAVFDKIDWAGEVEKANQSQKCSPTLSILSTNPNALIWVSAYGEKPQYFFLGDYSITIGKKKVFFGLFERDHIVNPPFRQDLSLEEARLAISLFLDQNHEELVRYISGT